MKDKSSVAWKPYLCRRTSQGWQRVDVLLYLWLVMCGCEDPSSLEKPHKTLLEHYFHVLLAKLSSWRPNQQSTENSVNSRARTCWPGKEPSPRTATSQPGWGSSSTWSHFRPFYKQYTTFYYNWSLTEAVYDQHLLFTKYMFIKCLLWAMYRMPWLTKRSWPPARPQHDLLSVLRTRWCSRPRDHRGWSRPCRHCQGCSSSGVGATESTVLRVPACEMSLLWEATKTQNLLNSTYLLQWYIYLFNGCFSH